MPKVGNTRKQCAEKLLERVERGPHFSNPAMFGGKELDTQEATHQYQLWVNSWIINDLIELIPELKKDRS